jgi:hypothetical protein
MSQTLQSDPGQRDQVLGRLLLQALNRRIAGHGAVDVSTCPGTELLSGYVDRALDSEETARWELHFADCVRCRSTLAAFMTHNDTPQVASQIRQPAGIGPRAVVSADGPAQQNRAKQTMEVPQRVKVQRKILTRESAAAVALPKARWILRWIAPALSLAAGAGIGYALHSGPRVGTARFPPRIESERGAEFPSENDSNGSSSSGLGGVFATGGGSAPAASSNGAISQSLAHAGELFSSRNAGRVSSSPPRPAVFASPDGKAFWRIGVSGRIERSTDQGNNWQVQPSGVSTDLLTGVALSDQVAWVIGRGGILLRTTDGKGWQRVATPGSSSTERNLAGSPGAGAAPAPLQWTQVSATDALHATITSVDSKRFATANGGITWKPVAPADTTPAR